MPDTPTISRDMAILMLGWLDLQYLLCGKYSAGRFGRLETDAGRNIRAQREELLKIIAQK